MRPLRLSAFAFAIVSFIAGPAAFAQTATTDPVGFIAVNVASGSVSSPVLSLVAPTLMQAVAWQGAISTIAGTTITVAGTPWTPNQFNAPNGAYFVEVTSGANAGAWTDIAATTTSTLTTNDDLSAFASAGSIIRIRQQVTIGSFLGVNNSAGLHGSTAPATSDEILVYDGANATIYWYYDGSDSAGPAGWYDLSYNAAANVIIAPNEGVVIRRKTGGSVNFLSMGTVKTGNTYYPIRAGLNVLGTASAQGLTLATSGLYTGSSSTGVKGSTGASSADQVTIYSASGPTIYWYYDASDSQGPAGWYDLSFNASGSVSIAPGSSLVVNRQAPGVAFNWAVPSPSSF